MSHVNELIERLCPNGVEWKTLGEVCEILDSQRKPVSKSNRVSGQYPYYGANGIQDYVDDFLFDGTFLLVGEDGSVIKPNKTPIVHWASGKIWVNNHAHILAEKSDIALLRYLFYSLQCVDVSDIVRGVPPKLNQENLKGIQIPLPPLEIQNCIVEILDQFTNLTANLTAELNLRRKQFEHYREKLLSLDGVEGVEMKTLGEIAISVSSGKNKSKIDDGEYIVYGSTGEIAKCNNYVYDKTQILIARVGANAGFVYLASGKYDVSDNTIIVDVKDDNSLHYIYYLLRHLNLNKYAKGGGQPLITAGEIKKIQIPVPPLAVQQSIVEKLDKFTALIENIEKELALRQKQYEYYREQLLSFNS